MSLRRMMLFTLGAKIKNLIEAFKTLVQNNQGVFEAEVCMEAQLTELDTQGLLDSATNIYTANSYADGETFQLRPSLTNTPIRNLLWNTGIFNTLTSTINAASYGPSAASTDPFGGTYSNLLAETAAAGVKNISFRVFPYIKRNTNYTFSIYFKKGTGATAPDVIQLYGVGGGLSTFYANFNITTLAVNSFSTVSTSIQNVGNGWVRCSVTVFNTTAVDAGTFGIAFINNNISNGRTGAPGTTYNGVTTSNIFAYGMQVEEGTSVTTYQDITHPLLLNNAGGVVRLGTLATKLNSDKTVGFAGYNLFRGSSTPELPLLFVARATTQANVAQAPDGTMTAYKMVEDTSNGSHFMGGDVLNLRKPDTTATFTVYMKAAERTFGFIQFNDNPRFPTARINLTNGTISSISSGITLYSEDVGNGWYKYIATATRLSSINIATSNFGFGPMLNSTAITYTGDGTSGILVWQPQAVLGTTPKPSLPSTLNFFPKLSYNDFDGYNDLNTCPNLNLELGIGNLCPLSEDFNRGGNLLLHSQDWTQAVWAKGGATIVSSTRVAPDGTSTGTELSDVGASSTPGVPVQSFNTTSTTLTFSIYTKSVSLPTNGTRTFLLRNSTTSTNFDFLNFNYSSTGNLGNGWFSQNVGNGWFRLSYTRTTGISIGDLLTIYYGRTNTAPVGATDVWQVWGAQVEPNEILTDYTLTTTAIALGATTNNMTVTSRTEPSPNPDYLADTLSATSNNALLRKFGTPAAFAQRRIFSIYLKRKTGTGQVTVSAGGTGVVANLSTSEWTRVYHVGATLAGNFTATSGVFTVTFTVNHGLSTGDSIYFDGPGSTDFSVAAITVVNPTTITFRFGTTTSSGVCAVYANVGIVNLSTAGDEVYAWGAQLELSQTFLNNLPTSYIPAFATGAVSRSSEAFYLNIPSTVNKTVLIDFKKIGANNNTTTSPIFFLGDNLGPTFANNYVGVNGSTSITMVKRVNQISTTFANPLSSYGFITNKYNKFAFVFNGTNVDIWIDGVLQTTTSFATPQLVRYLSFLSVTGLVAIKNIYCWDSVLTPAQLAQLTYSPMFPNGTTELTQVVGRAFASSLSLPSNSTLQALDTFIATLKTAGIWDKMDAIYNFAYNNTSVAAFSRLNLKSTFYSLGFNGTMTYQTNGYLAGAGSSYLTGYQPGVNNVQYQPESFSRTHILYQSASGAQIDQNTINILNDTFYNSNTNTHRALSNVNLPQSVDMSGTGLKSIMRTSSTSVTLYNQSTGTTLTQNRSGNYGASSQFFPFGNGLGVAFTCFGAPLTQTDINTIRTAYNTYLSAIGLTPFA